MADFLSRAAFESRLARGDRLHMELRNGARQWWFEAPYAIISDKIVSAALFGLGGSHRVMEAGASLFGLPMNSQTWLLIAGTG